MSLNISSGSRCFVDANILFYHFVAHPQFSAQVDQWFHRAMVGELFAVSSVSVIADALHRVMISEVEMVFGKPKGLSLIQKDSRIISRLRAYPMAAHSAALLPFELIPMHKDLLSDIAAISASCELMTNDSLIVAMMRQNNISHLITNDDDFDHVSGINVWKPR